MSITSKGNAGAASNMKVGFAKLQGEKFEYFMQTYSIILGCNDKTCTVDVDLSSLGGGIKISHHHVRIFYDFKHHGFFLEVLSKYGCLVKGILHLPGNKVKIDSQDLIQIGDVKFYFLLPLRSILGGPIGPRHLPSHVVGSVPKNGGPVMSYCSATTGMTIASGSSSTKKGTTNYYEDGVGGKMGLRNEYEGNAAGSKGMTLLTATSTDKNSKAIFQVDQDADDNLKLQELEEKDVITAVVKVLSDRFDPKQSVSLDKLHAEMVRKYSFVWDQIKVRKYLTSGDWPGSESKGNRWYGLLMLLKKYPERFTIVTKSNDGMDNPVVCFL